MSTKPVEAPSRLTVPTCIGCGAMGIPGQCETGCREVRLDLVPAASYDALVALRAAIRARARALGVVAQRLTSDQPCEGDWRAVYRSLQGDARAVLSRHPGRGQDCEDWESSEFATTWWCERCGGLDAPQPCLGICVWRPAEWVQRSVYEHERERALAEHDREQELESLLRLLASVTPRDDGWERSWKALADRARAVARRHDA
ncbi:MAG: hypothetical protein ACYC0H_19780 [Solirubrobacteraceae bacterium]